MKRQYGASSAFPIKCNELKPKKKVPTKKEVKVLPVAKSKKEVEDK